MDKHLQSQSVTVSRSQSQSVTVSRIKFQNFPARLQKTAKSGFQKSGFKKALICTPKKLFPQRGFNCAVETSLVEQVFRNSRVNFPKRRMEIIGMNSYWAGLARFR